MFTVREFPEAICSCHKQKTAGLPCSYICTVLHANDSLERLATLIHPRWLLNDGEYREVIHDLEKVVPSLPEPLQSHGLTTKQRYGALISEAMTLCAQACQHRQAYERLHEMFTHFSRDILPAHGDADAPVVELAGSHPGRPK
jgi:hypothetical protein